jgi:hypothetical protein
MTALQIKNEKLKMKKIVVSKRSVLTTRHAH